MTKKDLNRLKKELGNGNLVEISFSDYHKAIILTISHEMFDYNSNYSIYLNKTMNPQNENYEAFNLIKAIFPSVDKAKVYYTSYTNSYEIMMDKFGFTKPWKVIDDGDIKMLDSDCKFIIAVPNDIEEIKFWDGKRINDWEIIIHDIE